jgi:hypothetical protein
MLLIGMCWSGRASTSVSFCHAYLQLCKWNIVVGSETFWHPLSASWSLGYDCGTSCIPRSSSVSQDVWRPVECTLSGSHSIGWRQLCLWLRRRRLRCCRHCRQGSDWWGGMWGCYWASLTQFQWSSQWCRSQWGPVCIALPRYPSTQSLHPPRGTSVQDLLLQCIWQVTDAPRLEGNCVGL